MVIESNYTKFAKQLPCKTQVQKHKHWRSVPGEGSRASRETGAPAVDVAAGPLGSARAARVLTVLLRGFHVGLVPCPGPDPLSDDGFQWGPSPRCFIAASLGFPPIHLATPCLPTSLDPSFPIGRVVFV